MSPVLFCRLTAVGGWRNNRMTPSLALEVAVAIIEQADRFLISRRLPEDSFGGFWEFPGGKCNPGETLQECLAREVREELGITITVGQKLQVIEHEYPQRTVRLHCFSCRIVSGEPQAIECAAWRWVSPRELPEYEFPPASRALLARFQK